MIKIEKITEGTKATITRKSVSGDVKVNLYVSMLISHAELATMEIKNGQVTYSIDEEKVVTAYGDKEDAKDSSIPNLRDTIHTNSTSSTTDNGSDDILTDIPVSIPIDSVHSTATTTSTDGTIKAPAKKAGKTVKAR